MVTRHLEGCSTGILFSMMKQRIEELGDLETRYLDTGNPLLQRRIFNLRVTIQAIRSIVIKKTLDKNMRLTHIAKLLNASSGLEEEVYSEVFKLRLLTANEFVPADILNRAIEKLSLEQLMEVISVREGSTYSRLASERFNDMLFDVEDDVMEELHSKILVDRKGR